MSSTNQEGIDRLKLWLDTNAYWREDLVIGPSKCGGSGVFFSSEQSTDEEDDPLLLRIPKSNVLAAKNSFIYNLVVEYEFEKVDVSSGMFGLILAVIYEVSIAAKSPWYDYLNSIEFDKSSVPVCLWNEDDKANFRNTEVDLLNLLKDDELLDFYLECCKFAITFSQYAEVPSVLDVNESDRTPEKVKQLHSDKVHQFGRFVSSVISRAFKIDNYYDLAMVPGADLFNHMKPALEGKKVVGKENIHFICDGTVCDACGEEECDHESEDEEEIELEELEELSGTEEIEDDNMEEDSDSSDDESSDDEEDLEEEEEQQEEEKEEEAEAEEPITEITLDYIYQMEQDLESEAETNQDPDEDSTVSLSGGEDNEEEEEVVDEDPGQKDDLAKELSENSRCCDVVLISAPSKEHDYEIFNSYGNELSNPYLFQRYGFITDVNVNDSCLLSVQLFKYLKNYKGKLTKEKVKQLDQKFEWFEGIGFDIVNQLIAEKTSTKDSCCDDKECSDHKEEEAHDHKEEEAHGCCDDDDCNDCEEDEADEQPESWQLSPRIKFTGDCTLQTYAILTLIGLPFTLFKHKILSAKKERKLVRRIREIFVEDETSRKEHNALIKEWCQERIGRYPQLANSPHKELIEDLVKQEKSVLQKFIDQN